MNRTIKFRGKSLDDGKWVYGDLLHPATSCRIVSYDETEEEDGAKRTDFHYHDVDPKTVGQFTGLKDCDYTDIYEGDIIKKEFYEHPVYFKVEWDGDGFIVHNPTDGFTDGLFHQCVTHNDVRVIGTVYDSREDILKNNKL